LKLVMPASGRVFARYVGHGFGCARELKRLRAIPETGF
jgi:hypothetical protein